MSERFDKLVAIIKRLRNPDDGCPWDREQSHRSIRQYILEETYELIEAIDADDADSMCEELGDVLLHILFHADIESDRGNFSIDDVIDGISEKLIRRHPHIFGDVEVADSDEVLKNWEHLKLKERSEKNNNPSLLDGVPHSMPALALAQRMQERAARLGFDWKDEQDVLAKVDEEMAEMREAREGGIDELEDEIGDLIFAVVNYARFVGLNAEMALRRTTEKFEKRFRFVESGVRESGNNSPTLAEMDILWEKAKEKEEK